MKKIIVLALLMIGTTIIAQEKSKKHHHRDEMEQFTPEQQSQLMVKEMTLKLDLNESQQKEIGVLFSEKMTKKEAFKSQRKEMKEKGTQPTSDELFAMKSKILDEKIDTNKRMKKILDNKQFEKWTALNEEHHRTKKENHSENQTRKG